MTYLSEAARLARLQQRLLALGDLPEDPAGQLAWVRGFGEALLGSGLPPAALGRLIRDDPEWAGFARLLEELARWVDELLVALRARLDSGELRQ